ncbi:MAG: hypothetical protein GY745_02075 [Actinomycetia bacterium]|nr:hypothetical protein [Actinomycetes bacterium]
MLIAPHTDPAWTPLFVPAGAVIVDVGAALSHRLHPRRCHGLALTSAALHSRTRAGPTGETNRSPGRFRGTAPCGR